MRRHRAITQLPDLGSWPPVASETLGSRRPSPRWRAKPSSGPGPRQIVRWGGGYRTTPDPDLVYLYTDEVIGILPEPHLNNGAVHHADMRVCAKFAVARAANSASNSIAVTLPATPTSSARIAV